MPVHLGARTVADPIVTSVISEVVTLESLKRHGPCEVHVHRYGSTGRSLTSQILQRSGLLPLMGSNCDPHTLQIGK